jgi:hypothetical protein
MMSEPPKTFAEASAEYDARNRESKVILGLIVAPLALWFVTWLVSRFF